MRAVAFLLIAALQASATTHCLTIAGLGGEPDYDQRFGNWVKDVQKVLSGSDAEVKHTALQGAEATKARIREALDRLSRESKPQDQLVLFLIGHGSFDGLDYKINVAGPDVTAVELASMLDRVPSARQLVINATSASGASVHALQRQNRTVITATKSGSEKNATVFPRYWIEALRDGSADTDKNEIITALEAFKFAESKTKQFYETNKRLATEHPTLDGGDAQATLTAGRFPILRIGSVQAVFNDPAKRSLLDQRTQLEEEIDRLKFQKAAMPQAQYRQEMQKLLLALAQVQAELDK